MSKQVSRMQSEEERRSDTPSDLYMLVPIGHRAAVRRFARCFGLDREDLARFIRASYAGGRG